MRIHARATPAIESAVSFDGFQLLFGGQRDAVFSRDLIKSAGLGAFHARAIVAPDVDDERVIGDAHVLDRFHDLTNCGVCVFLEACINLHLMSVELLHFRWN